MERCEICKESDCHADNSIRDETGRYWHNRCLTRVLKNASFDGRVLHYDPPVIETGKAYCNTCHDTVNYTRDTLDRAFYGKCGVRLSAEDIYPVVETKAGPTSAVTTTATLR